MESYTNSDGVSYFDNFLNQEYLLPGSDRVEETIREAQTPDSPSTFHSPKSMQSESTEWTDRNGNSNQGMPTFSEAINFDALSFLQQTFGDASMAHQQAFGADPFRQPQPVGTNAAGHGHSFGNFQTQHGAEMWRSVSDGSALSQSIGSLALDNVPPLHTASPFAFQQPVQVKSEDDDNALSASFSHLGQPFSTPMQPIVQLPTESYALSPPLEKKRKLSDTGIHPEVGSQALVGPSEATEPKDAAPKLRGKKKAAKNAGDAKSGEVFGQGSTSTGADTVRTSRKSGPRRPPPSASQVTEAGKPFPVIDTTAKHSSLFVHPDTSGLTKREARLVKNRAAAFLSRQRKREQFEELEVKCKAMSIMAWKMWEVIAGSDAPIEALERTPIPALLADEDPMAIICLEQVIAKQGASIAPTTEDPMLAPSRDSAEPDCGNGDLQDANYARPWQADAIDKLRADLAVSRKRERDLISELDALKQAKPSAAQPAAPTMAPVEDASSFWQKTPEPVPVAAFRTAQPLAPSLTIAPGLSPASAASTSQTKTTDFGRIKVEADEPSFSFAVTPTIESFSEAARNSKKKSQHLSKIGAPKFGLGLFYRQSQPSDASETASMPSSPSSLSTMSDATQRHGGDHQPHLATSRRTTSSMALMVILVSIALLGMPAGDLAKLGINRSSGELNSGFSLGQVLGPVEPTSRYSLIRPAGEDEEEENEDDVVAATQPSSHLSDTDLSLGFEVDAAAHPQQPQRKVPAITVDTEMPDESASSGSQHQQQQMPPTPSGEFLGSSAAVALVAVAALTSSQSRDEKKNASASRLSDRDAHVVDL